jgi:hypothetical protein
MVRVSLGFADFMDARPLPQASIDVDLRVAPRFKEVIQLEGFKPKQVLRPDFRFGELLSASGETDDEGRVTLDLRAAEVFERLASVERDGVLPEDVVGFVDVGLQFLGISYRRGAIASVSEDASEVEATLPVDLGMSIVGHTTSSTARLWFTVPFEPGDGQTFICALVSQQQVLAASLFPPVGGAGELGVSQTVAFSASTRTAVVDFDGLSSGLAHDYALVLQRGLRRFTLASGRFRTPEEDQPRISFAFGSCHLPTLSGTVENPSEAAILSLERWQRLADRRDYEFLLLTGDQIYGDGIENKWPDDEWFPRYLRRYRQLWAYRPMRQVLRNVPTYMILDDHDVADDFGTVLEDFQRIDAALNIYRAFQHALNPGDKDDPNSPLHYHFRWGPASFFVMDGRTRRQEFAGAPVFGREQLAALQEWAASPETLASDLIFFIAPVPLALLPTEIIREIADELAEQAGAAVGAGIGTLVGLGVGGVVAGPLGAAAGAGIGAAVLGTVGYTAGGEVLEPLVDRTLLVDFDLAERWDRKENQFDLSNLLNVLFGLANGVGEEQPRPRAVFILAGDIHAGTMHLIRSLPSPVGVRHDRNPVIIQLTSSAISHEPVNSTLWVQAVSRIDEDVDLDLHDINFLTAWDHRKDWEGISQESIDLDNVFGKGRGAYILDPDQGGRYVAEFAGLLMERTVGRVAVERRDPARRVYRFHVAIEGQSQLLESRFDLDLDAELVTPRMDDARFVRRLVPSRIEPLTPTDVEVTMQNTGATDWTQGYALDIVQDFWGVGRVPVTTTVRSGREHTFRFRITAPSSGSFFLTTRMNRPGGGVFGSAAPTVRITASAGDGGGNRCADLREERERLEATLDQLQSESPESPAEKQLIAAEIKRTRAALAGINRQLAQAGCE